MTWSASQYVKFEDERTRPVKDLVAAIPSPDPAADDAREGAGRNMIDLGCGPGNSTAVLAARFAGAVVSGLDSSTDMIEAARKRLPDLQFTVADVSTWDAPGPFDTILGNAVFQWVPDHATLFPALAAKLAPGGSLAVQMPDNLDEPAHRLMREVAAHGPWAPKLAGAATAREARHDAPWYYNLLKPHCTRVDIWRTTYYHVLQGGPSAVVEWFKGTGLRPFIDPLEGAEREAWLARYAAEIAKAYPALPDGTVMLPFPRLFIVATR